MHKCSVHNTKRKRVDLSHFWLANVLPPLWKSECKLQAASCREGVCVVEGLADCWLQLLPVARTVLEVADYLHFAFAPWWVKYELISHQCSVPISGWLLQKASEFLAGISWKSTSRAPGKRLFLVTVTHVYNRLSCDWCSYNKPNACTAMTSWTTCWSVSRHLGPVCHDLASPSTSPPSSSMASSLCTTDSVLFSWVRNY